MGFLENKKALITGSSRGLGKEIARRYLEEPVIKAFLFSKKPIVLSYLFSSSIKSSH